MRDLTFFPFLRDEDDEAPSAKRPNIFNIDDSELGSQDILLSEYKRKAKGEQPYAPASAQYVHVANWGSCLFRRSGPVPEAVPISLDEGVETIGEAYVEEEGHEVAERKLGTSRLLGGRVTDAYQTEHVVL